MTSERLLLLASLAFFSACHSHVEGITVELAVHAHAVETIVDAEENVLDVTRFSLTLDSLELLPCEDPVARVLRELFLPGVAKAHHGSHGSPTVFDGPLALSLTEDGTLELGVLNPPPGRYCGVFAIFGGALFEGELGGEALSHELAFTATAHLTFEPLTLDADHREGALALHVDAQGAFDDVDLATASSETLAGSLRESLRGFLSVELGEISHAH